MSENNRDFRLEVLHQLFSAATHEASAAMCCWTNGLITMSLDEVREIPLEEVASEFPFADEPLTMVVLTLEGEVGGQMVLCFDDLHGRQMASLILGKKFEAQGNWTELEKSALMETGNILGCAYMNALTRLVNERLIPSPPYFIQDFGQSVLQQALMAQDLGSDEVLICRTCFRRQDESLDWSVFFVPTQTLRQRMEQALHQNA